MKFKNEAHEKAFNSLVRRMNTSEQDVYRLALAYLLTLDTVCFEHIGQLYDFEERCIYHTALEQPWQTGTSLKTTRLAFNLFTGSTGWCPDEDLHYCSVADIFCCEYAPYFLEAIKIR